MNLLFFGIVVLLGVGLSFVLIPLMRKPKPAMVARCLTDSGTLALQVLREQKADLDAERNAGKIDEEIYQRNLEEIERRALQENPASTPEAASQPSANWAVAATFVFPLAAVALYLMLGNPAAVDVPKLSATPPAPNAQGGVSPEQINAMVARLAERVAKNPDDVTGLAMLARSYMVLQRYDEAAKIYEQLAAKKPDDADVLADWADAVASKNGRSLAGEPAQILARAVKLDPSNPKVLALVGTAAFEKGDYAMAIKFWQLLLKRIENIPEAGQMAASVHEGIAEAQRRMQDNKPKDPLSK